MNGVQHRFGYTRFGSRNSCLLAPAHSFIIIHYKPLQSPLVERYNVARFALPLTVSMGAHTAGLNTKKISDSSHTTRDEEVESHPNCTCPIINDVCHHSSLTAV